MINSMVIKAKASKLISDSKILIDQIDEINEWNSYSKILMNIGKVVTFVEYVVMVVEQTYAEIKDQLEYSDGSDKLDAAVEIIDDLLELPFWLELVDEHVIKMLISVVVHYLNEKYGHIWEVLKIE